MVYNLPENITRPDLLLSYLAGEINGITSALLFMFLVLVVILGYSSDRNRDGKGRILGWLCLSSFLTATIGIILLAVSNVITLVEVVLWIILFIICTALFWLINDN